jgi:hypothetical protein
MSDVLTREERLKIVAELCPRYGTRRPCDYYDLARTRAEQILGETGRAELSADYLLMRAVDRYLSGQLSPQDLFRCRVLAYYMTFARGGEEWAKWGVVASVRPGEFEEVLDEPDLEDLFPPIPEGPPWRSG